MAVLASGGAGQLERLAALVESDPELAWQFPQVRRLGRLTPPGRVAQALREQAAALRERDYSTASGPVRRSRRGGRV